MFFNQPYNKDTNEVSHLEGHVYQTLFDYKGEQYWLGADYYPVPEGYLVSYKAGLVKSWFESNFEYGNRFEDVIVNCAEDEITQVILKHDELILWPDPAYTAGIDGGGASPAKASI